jgi:transcriptional regulator with XRE-family HTH domain
MKRALIVAVAVTVRQFRKTNNMSQETLADKAGLDRTYISGVERGVRNITLSSLEHIVDALEIDMQTFLRVVIEYLNQPTDQSLN